MMKRKRSARMVDITRRLLENPHRLFSLTEFVEEYRAAKSSISEDLSIIKEVLEEEGVGLLQSRAGAAGGVLYIPYMPVTEARKKITALLEKLQDPGRILPGGYLYISDLLGNPGLIHELGKMIASYYRNEPIDVVMTVETKGIPLAYACAHHLNVPVVIVRRDSQITEGSLVTLNYVSGSTKRIQTMSLSRRMLPEKSRVLIVDDFMRAGGTVRGMKELLQEFKAELVGVSIFVEGMAEGEKVVDRYLSLIRLVRIDDRTKKIEVELGNYFQMEEC
ncbi:MAG: pur operon repressor [Thermicanus sp.]|nr:pur operon repressor [Thermicanus sp.]